MQTGDEDPADAAVGHDRLAGTSATVGRVVAAWSACILAGGRGRRLAGRIKPLVEVSGRSILARQIEALAGLGVRPVLIAPDPAPFAGLGLTVWEDAVAAGSLGALYTAVHRADTTHVLVLAGDMPFLSSAFLGALVGLAGDHDAVVPRPRGRWQPLCALYHRRVAPRLRAAVDAGHWRVTEAVAALDVRTLDDADLAPFDPDGRLLLNVNTPDDYLRADPDAAL
ncbi:MAG: molybdenum cofactor guanylyltransferase [Acidobacteriota bacterium]